MNRETRVRSALPTRAKSVGHLRQVAAVAAALVLGIGSNAQTTAVRAASAQDATPVDKTFSLSFHPPSLICVGEGSPVKVTTLLEMSGTNPTGQHFDYRDNVVPGITIEAKVQDQSIATVSPSHDSTGMLPSPDDLLLPGQLSSPYHQRAEVTFTIKGLKPGTDNLYLTAHIPQRISGAAGTQKEAAVVFRVAQCRYQVKVASLTYFTAPGLTSYLVATTDGVMALEDKSGYSNTLRGDASVDWTMESFSPYCSHQHDVPKGPAHLEGTVNADDSSLDVHVTFDPFEMDTTNCASGSQGSFPVPPVDVKVPAGGGFKNMPVSFKVGNEAMSGRLSIYVKSIPGN
jgi:hypothetical protein